jgi:hypothetical protein
MKGGVSVQAYQVDWEAILSRSAEPFIASVSSWLYPPAAQGSSAADTPSSDPKQPSVDLASLPPVKDVLSTIRQRLEAMNAS